MTAEFLRTTITWFMLCFASCILVSPAAHAGSGSIIETRKLLAHIDDETGVALPTGIFPVHPGNPGKEHVWPTPEGVNADRPSVHHGAELRPAPTERCLAEDIYHEARGEGVNGMVAVANVVMNRVKTTGRDVCHVVYLRNETTCAFTWTCQRHSNPEKAIRRGERESWEKSRTVAQAALGTGLKDVTGGATSFQRCQTSYLKVKGLSFIKRINHHCFYMPLGGDGITDDGRSPEEVSAVIEALKGRHGYVFVVDSASVSGFRLKWVSKGAVT